MPRKKIEPAAEIIKPDARSLREWIVYVDESWRAAVAGVVETGRRLEEAKSAVGFGGWYELLSEVGISPSTASKLRMIAKNAYILEHEASERLLPRSWDTLYLLTTLDNELWAYALKEGLIRPDMTARDVTAIKREMKETDNQDIERGQIVMPEGRFATIVIDPPWPMQFIARDVRPNQTVIDYPTMSILEIAALPLQGIADEDCHIFLWTTPRFLMDAGWLLKAWDATYVCPFIWHKSGGFQPVGLPQYNAELVLYGRIGSPEFLDTKDFPLCFEGLRREHSRKPDGFYDMVRRVTPEPRLEMFAREAREGFARHGLETSKFAA